MSFGRHQGLTYEEVLQQQPGYCQWALGLPRPFGDLRHFTTWLRQRQSGGASPRGNGQNRGTDLDFGQAGPTAIETAIERFRSAELRSDESSSEGSDGEESSSPMRPRPPSPRQLPASSLASSRRPGSARRSRWQDLVEALPRVDYDPKLFYGTPHPETCPICMEDWDPAEADIVLTPCFHVFHSSCLGGWVERSRDCPSCRWDISDTGESAALKTSRSGASIPSGSVIHVQDDD